MDEPVFEPIEYKVKKKGGILKMTAELLEDTAAKHHGIQSTNGLPKRQRRPAMR